MKRSLLWVFAASFAAAGAVALVAGEGVSAPTTRTFVAVADAYVNLGSRGVGGNEGNERTLRVEANPRIVSYVRFNVDDVPGTIRGATLRVFAEDAAPAGFSVHGVASNSWQETDLSPRDAPAISSSPVVGSGSVRADAWVDVDVSDLVSEEGAVSMALVARGDTSLRISSRETGGHAPLLVVQGNRAPEADGDTVATDEDVALTIPAASLLANDSDLDGDPLRIVSVTPLAATNGTVALVGASVVYTPTANFWGDAEFRYTISDGFGASATATVRVTVRPRNDAPVASNGSASTDEDAAVDIPLVASDIDGDSLTRSIVSGPSHGTLGTVGGSVVYTPAADYHGPDSFTFRANDGSADSNVATISITVRPRNDAPVASDGSAATDEDATVEIPLAATDVDGDSLTRSIVSGPSHGTLGTVGGSVVYTPAANYNGPDSFTFRASDGIASSNAATISITVRPAQDAPVASDASATTDEDSAAEIPLPVTDVDGDSLTRTIVSGPTHGSLGAVGSTVVYTPAADYNGPDSFTFKASDGTADSNVATISITVRSVNDAPEAADTSATTDENVPVQILLPAADRDGDAVTRTIVDGPSHGSLGPVSLDGLVLYTPAANFDGADSFTFRADDGEVESNVATVAIQVRNVNQVPVATDVSAATDENAAVEISLAATDADGDPVTFQIVDGPAHGSLAAVVGNAVVYTPDADFDGSDSFTFKASDGTADSNVATASIEVRNINRAPVATEVAAATDENAPVEITLAATDPDGEAVTFAIVDGPAHGSLGPITGDTVTYTPDADFDGPDSFTFRASDGSADSNVATVSITVRNLNRAPVATDVSASTDENVAVEVTLAATDPDGEPVTFAIVSGPAHGSLGPVVGNTVVYTPDAGYDGPDEFTFKADDGSLDSNTAMARITVRNLNGAPVATDVSASTDENTPVQIQLAASDGDGDPLTFAIGDGPAHGSLGPITGDTVTYTPDADFDGADSFTFRASDGSADSNVATVSITIRDLNRAPVATDVSASTDENVAVEVTLAATDPDGDPVTFAIVSGPAHGSLGAVVGNTVVYTPDTGYDGPDEFTFKASDGPLDSNTAMARITVRNLNRAPIASDVSASTDENTPVQVQLAASDEDGDPLTFQIVDGPAHGSLGAIVGDAVTYTPAAGFSGGDSFSYRANDGTDDSNTAIVSITVESAAPVNRAPTASDASVTVDRDVAEEITLQASDPDGDPLTFSIVGEPAHGTLTAPAGDSVTYTPAAGYSGPDQFTFRASDGTEDSNVATVSIDVVFNDTQPAFPIRAAFYYPWFPNAWRQHPPGASASIEPFTKYTPKLGYYDSGSASLISTHIAEMQHGKIEVGIASWRGQGHHTDGRIPALLAGAAGTPFRWALYHEQESTGNPTVAELQADLTYIRDRYGRDPSYLRVDGKFVVFVYGASGETCEMADRWQAANTVGAYVVLKAVAGYRDPVTGCRDKVDDWHQYVPALAADRQSGHSYTISPGFHHIIEAAPRLGRDIARWRQNIRDMVASGERWQLVTTFNEWGEGTSVEAAMQWPSGSGHGDYLDALHDDGAEPAASDPVLLAAGDIADCSSSAKDEETALLVGLYPAARAGALGDLVYEDGTASEFTTCYDPSWGAFKDRTLPVPGNHEYRTAGATGYFGYWGPAAGDPAQGYYSTDIGAWHVVVLNTNGENACAKLACGAGSPQEQWLRADLAAHPARCTLAMWHHPRFSSGSEHGSTSNVQALWQALYEGGADLVLQGHEHNYERFGPLTAWGAEDAEHGIRSFVVGTGGKGGDYPFGSSLPFSEARMGNIAGVLELTLHATSFDWVFLPIGGQSMTDVGSATCNDGVGPPLPTVDTTPPSAPTGVTAVANSPTEVRVEWLAANDNIGVTTYRVVRNDGRTVNRAASSALALVDRTVLPGTTYSYTVTALDEAGNASEPSEAAEVTTPTLDTTAPTAPSGVTAVATSQTQVKVQWQASTDDRGVTGYRVLRDGGVSSNVTGLELVDSTVVAGTTYRYVVFAMDAAGNESEASEEAVVTTPQTLTFAPTDDAYVTDNSTEVATNFGSAPDLLVDGTNGTSDLFSRQALLKFDVSGIAGRRVVRATLRLNTLDGSTSGGDFFRTADAGWLETAVTWETAPATDGAAIASLGSVGAGSVQNVDVTALVTGDGPVSIRITSAIANGVTYASKENPNSALAPQLTVEVE